MPNAEKRSRIMRTEESSPVLALDLVICDLREQYFSAVLAVKSNLRYLEKICWQFGDNKRGGVV